MVSEPVSELFDANDAKLTCTFGTQMQSLELGNTSPTDSKLRRRGRRYLSAPRAYLSSFRRRLESRDFDPLKARLKTVAVRVAKILLVLLAAFAAWIVFVVLLEIYLGLIIVQP